MHSNNHLPDEFPIGSIHTTIIFKIFQRLQTARLHTRPAMITTSSSASLKTYHPRESIAAGSKASEIEAYKSKHWQNGDRQLQPSYNGPGLHAGKDLAAIFTSEICPSSFLSFFALQSLRPAPLITICSDGSIRQLTLKHSSPYPLQTLHRLRMSV